MKKLILAVMLTAIMLTGCDAGKSGMKVESLTHPKITQYGVNTNTYVYSYAVDERTRVVYIIFDSKYRAGIAVALNADGTPVTKEQLEAWRGDNERID